jgi:micrococcal nuclease
MKPAYYTKIIIIIISFLIIMYLLFTGAFFDKGVTDRPEKFRVIKVHDGDTVSIRTRSFAGIPLKIERVRLVGIDTPELKQEPWGRRSARHLKKLLSESDWVVRIELDLEPRDRHGRLLVYLWDKNGRLINERMIKDGYAVVYTRPPNVKYVERFKSAQEMARAHNAGFWKRGGLKQTPEDWRRENPRQ